MKKVLLILSVFLLSCSDNKSRQEIKSDGTQVVHQKAEDKSHGNLRFESNENLDDLEVIHNGYFFNGIYRLRTDSGTFLIIRESGQLAICKE